MIGATALGFHGVVERLRAAFRAVYPGDARIDDISTADLLGEYPAVRYYPPSGDLYFDILARLGDAARFETVEAELKQVDSFSVPVATPAALYRLKKGTLRAKDPRMPQLFGSVSI